MKSHLCRFFTWLCMKTSVVSWRRLSVSISFLLHFVHLRSLANEIILRKEVVNYKHLESLMAWDNLLHLWVIRDVLHCISWVLSTSVNTSLCICDFLKSVDTFSPELLKSWLSTFWDAGHCSDGCIRTRLFWCCRAATEFGSQSPHQGT